MTEDDAGELGVGEPITVRIPTDLLSQVLRVRGDANRSRAVRDSLTYWLEHHSAAADPNDVQLRAAQAFAQVVAANRIVRNGLEKLPQNPEYVRGARNVLRELGVTCDLGSAELAAVLKGGQGKFIELVQAGGTELQA